ncbi:hypothetical protein CY34DRAFT_16599 [Suillus luteus UH-Slu-Lm8-n1]|uniref:F-box domain-containing protein n=1 Tax=Suillus luteus UH-Slu-Lm8-n1 TaxID=930992 RepID=A0A0D0A352_9AGAM|nr:hypothetical protein CY34DRAFT_16599 [Suillus luteus UH-Slu-Lm8-n1]
MSLIPDLLFAIVNLVFKRALHANNFTDLVNMASANKALFRLTIPLLWRELPSAQPLLHLLPTNVVVRSVTYDPSDRIVWHYRLRRIPFRSDLDRLHLYTTHIRAIRACGRPSLNFSACHTFTKLFLDNLSLPTLPHLERLQLTDPSDGFIPYIPNLVHASLRVLEIPNYAINHELIIAQLVAVSPPLHTLVYVDVHTRVGVFPKSIHLFPLLRSLTVFLPEPVAMQAIASLPLLARLEIVIDPARQTIVMHQYNVLFHHRLASLIITIVDSPDLDVAFPSLKKLLFTFPISCDKLTIIMPPRLQGRGIEAIVGDQNPSTSIHIRY